jgi:hypothetical protein
VTKTAYFSGALVFVTASVVASCAVDKPPVGSGPELRSIGSRAAYESLPRLSLVPVANVCIENAPACVLDYGGIAAASPDGAVIFAGQNRYKQLTLVVGDPPAPRMIGRTGDGPGEFRTVNILAFAPTGQILAADIYRMRFLKYGRDGRVLSTTTVPIPGGFLEAGFVDGKLRIIALDPPKRRNDSVAVSVYAVDSGAPSHQRLYSLPIRDKSRQLGDMIPVPRMFSPVKQWEIGSDGTILFTRGDSLGVDVFDPAGRYVRRFGFDVSTRAVTERDVARRREARLRGVTDPTMRQAIGSATSPMLTHAAITKIRWLENGQVWVRETEDEAGETVRWVVFGSDFSPMGVVQLPAEAGIIASRDSLVLLSAPAPTGSFNELVWAKISSAHANAKTDPSLSSAR